MSGHWCKFCTSDKLRLGKCVKKSAAENSDNLSHSAFAGFVVILS